MHVESVAWVSERKDVLSTAFWLLAMLAYVRETRRGGMKWAGWTTACMALGLLAKPMLVTLPLVLLLLDFWPLGRWRSAARAAESAGPFARSWPLVREKAPLMALALALHTDRGMRTPPSAESHHVQCPACGTTNRIPQDKVDHGLQPVCGRCKRELAVAQGPVVVTDATFPAEVERSALPVLVDAWAPWCGPCRALAPVIDQLASDLAGRVRVAKLNVDENPATAARFGLRSIPTLLVFSGGREVDRMVGVMPKAEIARRLARVAG
jgi:thioredoxin 2